jgi:predicted O-methyltransferase YrrM
MGHIGQLLRRASVHPKRAAVLAWVHMLPVGRENLNRETALPITWTYGKVRRRPFKEIFPQCSVDELTLLRPLDRDPDTSISIVEATYLCALARGLQPENVLEIGTFDGNTTLNLAINTGSTCRITTLDIGPPSDVGSQYKRSRVAGRVTEVIADSTRIDWSTLGGPFDFIFIDGCHTYAAARSDTANAIANLQPGGLIVWHDYGSIKDVARAVDEFTDRLEIAALEATTLATAFLRPSNGRS